MSEFLPIPKDHRAEYQRILGYAFSPADGPTPDENGDGWPPSLFDPRGVYPTERGKEQTPVSVCKLYYLDAWIRGEYRQIGGLGAVATPPEHRQQGYAKKLCRGALTEYHENDAPLVTLWPFETEFYRTLGWATANRVVKYSMAPDALPSADVDGRFVPLSKSGWDQLRTVEVAAGTGVALSLRRSQEWWEERTLANWDGGGQPYCYGYERSGELVGYLVYTVDETESGESLSVQHIAYTDEQAFKSLLTFLSRHGAQIETVSLSLPPEIDLFARATRPDDISASVHPGPMVRLTTLSPLASLAWSAVELPLTIAVTDPLLDHLDGQFVLRNDDGEITVSARSEFVEEPDFEVPIGTLSQLYLGAIDIETALRVGGANCDESLVKPLSAVFTPAFVWLQEFF